MGFALLIICSTSYACTVSGYKLDGAGVVWLQTVGQGSQSV